jgi:hypothetical protein
MAHTAHVNHEVTVEPRTVEALDIAPGQSLVSLEGAVWVTASNSGADIILGPGDGIRFDKKARAVVGGLRNKSVRVAVN